jgi:DNA-binding transcriptional MocR family regulator
VESPAYYGLLSLIETLGLRVVEVPAGADGLDLQLLEAALSAHRIRAVLSVPNFNNPLGSLMPDEKKAALVELLAHHQVPLIEDDIYGDLNHEGERPRPAKAWDRQGLGALVRLPFQNARAGPPDRLGERRPFSRTHRSVEVG